MDLRKRAVAETSVLDLKDANDAQLICDVTGEPCRVHLHSPGSKEYARATAKKHNRAMDRVRRKGKSDMTPEQIAEENAEFLADCTAGWEHVEIDQLAGHALSKAIYADRSIGFIAEQVNQHLGEWGNFTKPAQTV